MWTRPCANMCEALRPVARGDHSLTKELYSIVRSHCTHTLIVQIWGSQIATWLSPASICSNTTCWPSTSMQHTCRRTCCNGQGGDMYPTCPYLSHVWVIGPWISGGSSTGCDGALRYACAVPLVFLTTGLLGATFAVPTQSQQLPWDMLIARGAQPPVHTHTPHPTSSHHFITASYHIHLSHKIITITHHIIYHHTSSHKIITISSHQLISSHLIHFHHY